MSAEKIISDWKGTPTGPFSLKVTVPANTTATIVVPGKNGGAHEVGSGHYQFTAKDPKAN